MQARQQQEEQVDHGEFDSHNKRTKNAIRIVLYTMNNFNLSRENGRLTLFPQNYPLKINLSQFLPKNICTLQFSRMYIITNYELKHNGFELKFKSALNITEKLSHQVLDV